MTDIYLMSISELLIVSFAVNAGVCVECLAIQARIELVKKKNIKLDLQYRIYSRITLTKKKLHLRSIDAQHRILHQ
jgi:hypothetical protein